MSMCQTQSHSFHLNSTRAFVSDINSTMTIDECERTFTIMAINIMINKTINMFETLNLFFQRSLFQNKRCMKCKFNFIFTFATQCFKDFLVTSSKYD